MDLISRKVAIDAVDSEMACTNPERFKSSEKFIKFMEDPDISSFGKWQWANGFNTAVVSAELQLKKLPSAQPERRWISVTERLPEEGERVLCTHTGGLNPNRQVIEHIYQNGTFTMGWDLDMNPNSPTFGQRYMGGVIAWMPLPEPYGGEQE